MRLSDNGAAFIGAVCVRAEFFYRRHRKKRYCRLIFAERVNFVKKWRNVLLGLVTVTMLGTMLAGCSGDGGGETTSGGVDTQAGLEAEKGKKLTIMIPGHNPRDKESWINQKVEEFKTQYPDVTVEFITASWENGETKILASAQSGDPIDVINDGANSNPKFALKGITQPLQNYINMENPNLHMISMDSTFKYGDNYYVAACATNVAVMFYNKTKLENNGQPDPLEMYNQGQWTWENFIPIAKAMTNESTKEWGVATNYPYIWFGSNQTSLLKLDENFKYTLNLESPEMRRAFEMLRDAYYTSKWTGYDGDPWQTFYKGSAAMLMDFNNVEQDIITAKEYGLVDFEYGVVPVPAGPDNKDNVSPITTSGWAIGNNADCPYHAGKLIDMFVDGQAAADAEFNSTLNPDNVKMYEDLRSRPYCTNSYDSAVGGGYDICFKIGDGQDIAQTIAEFKPIYEKKIADANDASTALTMAPETTVEE